MKAIGIVSELMHEPGVYGQGSEVTSEEVTKVTARFAAGMTISNALFPAYGLGELLLEMIVQVLRPVRLNRIMELPRQGDNEEGQPPQECIVVPSSRLTKTIGLHNDPVLYGLFKSRSELTSVLSAEGKNVDIWIMSLDTANRHFNHHGGTHGNFGTGLHLPHPKDPRVLIPASRYVSLLKDEVLQDWVRAFEALGAKEVVICDSTEAELNANVDIPAEANVTARLKSQYQNTVLKESTYGPGIFHPDRARQGKNWIDDFSTIGSIVEGRISGNQLSYREKVTVDASFGVEATVIKAIGANIKGGLKRDFELAIEFYPRPVST